MNGAVFYECRRCTACCRWPGEVRLSDEELQRLATFLGLSEDAFIQRYMRLRTDRRGLALAEQPDGACIFLDGRDCRVQPVKPRQCREFPNGWRFAGAERICRAVAAAADNGTINADRADAGPRCVPPSAPLQTPLQ